MREVAMKAIAVPQNGSFYFLSKSHAKGSFKSKIPFPLIALLFIIATCTTASFAWADPFVINQAGIDPHTKLILHCDGDVSDSQHPVTVHGNPQLVADAGESTGYMQLGGSDSLGVMDSADWDFGAGDFTIDFWVWFEPTGASQYIISADNIIIARADATGKINVYTSATGWFQDSIGPVINMGQWYHLALVRSGDSLMVFTNGALDKNGSISGSISGSDMLIGKRNDDLYHMKGRMKDIRISKGIARWTEDFNDNLPAAPYQKDGNTVLLLHFDKDRSNSSHPITFNGNPQIISSQGKFSGSYHFDGDGDNLTIPASDDWNFGTGDWTVDFWINFDNLSGWWQGIVSSYHIISDGWQIIWGGNTIDVWNSIQTGPMSSSAIFLSPGNWYHFAIVRDGNTIRYFVDGESHGTVDCTGKSFSTTTQQLAIGSASSNPYDFGLSGNIDEIRISKRIARWTQDFVPPTHPYQKAPKYINMAIDHEKIDEDLTDFPVLLHLSDNSGLSGFDVKDIFEELSSNDKRKQIAFFTSSEEQCYIEIERWDHLNAEAWLWVKVPQVSSTQNTELTFYYDSNQSDNTEYVGDTGEPAARNVWDDHFVGVWHMAQDPNGDVADAIKDSTYRSNHLTPSGSMTSEDLDIGKIGHAIEFDGTNDRMDKNLGTINAPMTLEADLFYNQIIQENYDYSAVLGPDNYSIIRFIGSNLFSCYAEGSHRFDSHIPGQEWTHFSLMADSNSPYLKLLVNGQEQSLSSQPGSPISTDGYLTVGCYGTGNSHHMDGKIDELRLSDITRSDAWIKATYHSNYDNLIHYYTISDTTPPPSVETLVVSFNTDGTSATLTWSGYDESAAGDIAQYRIYVETTSFTDVSELMPFATVGAGVFTYTAENLSQGTTYYFAVVAEDNAGNIQTTGSNVETEGTYVSGPVTEDTVWILAGSPYIVTDDITIRHANCSDTATLTIKPGVTVKLNPGTGLSVGQSIGDCGSHLGALFAQGTEVSPITFTSNAETPAPGDWKGIYFDDLTVDASSRLEYCVIEYGGHTNNANIYLSNAKPSIQRTVTTKSSHTGIHVNGTGCNDVPINCVTFENNQYGAHVTGNAQPQIHNSNFLGNSIAGVYNESSVTISAEHNWWGDENGPNQNGDNTSGNIATEPWLTFELHCITDPQTGDPPHMVDTLKVQNVDGGSKVILDWSGYDESVEGDIAHYFIYYSTDNFNDVSGMIPVSTVTAGIFGYTLENLDEDEVYFFAVVAVDGNGNALTEVTAVTNYEGPRISNLQIDNTELIDGHILYNSALISLDVEAFHEQAWVEFYLDGVLVYSDNNDSDGFTYYLDILSLEDGNHIVRIIAKDSAGYSNEVQYTLNAAFNAPKLVGKTGVNIGDQATLSIMNHRSGQNYTWSMVGGGSLSDSIGPSVIYTSPNSVIEGSSLIASTGPSVSHTALNSVTRCSDSATITVTDPRGYSDEKQVAVNSYPPNIPAYRSGRDCWISEPFAWDEDGSPTKYGWGCGTRVFDCTGKYIGEGGPSSGCWDWYPTSCGGTDSSWCDRCAKEDEYEDLRTLEMIEQGCCPGDPPPPGPKDSDRGKDPYENKPPTCPLQYTGNPISILNGNNYETEMDVQFISSGSQPLIFKRAYNSQSSTMDLVGQLGYGWSHNYNSVLIPSSKFLETNYLKIIDETGRGVYFQYIGNDKFVGAFNEKTTVDKDGDSYFWNRLDGSKYSFSSGGQLIWIDDETGNRTTLSYDGSNRLETITDTATGRSITLLYNAGGYIGSIAGSVTPAIPDGVWVTYGYDTYGNLASVTYADGSGFDYVYNDANDLHNLTEKKDKMGHLLSSWAYDGQDRAIENFTRDGRGVSIEYVNDTEVKVTDAYGITRTYTIGNMDGKKRVTDISGPEGCASCGNDVIRVEYDRALRVIEVEYANGLINQFDDFDSRGNTRIEKTGIGTSDEKTISYTFHPEMDAKLSRTEPSILGQGTKTTIWDYDDDGNDAPNENPTRLLYRKIEKGFTTDVSGAVFSYEYITSYTYNSKGQVLTIDGPHTGPQDRTTYTYSETTGDLLSVNNPLVGNTIYSDYDAAGNKGRVTDPNGNAQIYTYDGKGRIKTITNSADGSVTTYNYNTAGELTQVTAFNGITTGFAYDSAYGLMTKTTDALGNYIQYAYDDQGNRIEKSLSRSDDERTYHMRYDYQHPVQTGKLWKEINPDDTYVQYDYDAIGNIQTITDAKENSTSYDYDHKNRLIQVTRPGNVITSYAYDEDDNLISVTDAEYQTTIYTYDDAGRMITTISPDTGTTTYAYDAAGNLVSKTDANGNTVTYGYDTVNRLVGIHFPDSSQDITYTYDQGTNGKGRLIQMADPSGTTAYTYDALGNLIKEEKTIGGVTYTTEYAYDAAGLLTGITYPNGRTVSYQIDSAGRVTQVSTAKDGINDTVAQNIGYLPFGPISSLTYGNGQVLSQSFDQLYRPEGIVAGAILDFGYTVDPVGNITTISDNLDDTKNRSFIYDDLYRLTQATGIFGTIGYTYDNVGNRLSRTVDGQTDTYQYQSGKNRLDQITGANPQGFTYDANGNTTAFGDQTLAYNQNDRLIKVTENSTVKGEYTYNGNGQRVKKVSSGETVIYHYDRFGNLIGESTIEGIFTSEYIYLNSMRLAAFVEKVAATEITVNVSTDELKNLSGIRVYAFTESGSYTGKYAITDEEGNAVFAISDFSDGTYKFRADYLSNQFWSDVMTVPGTYSLDIEIEEETTTLEITRGGVAQQGVKVYLFNAAGAYLGLYEITDENGEVSFDLPVGMSFKFRADTLGSQYFSDIIEIVSGETNTFVMDIGGGLLTLTVDKGDSVPLVGVKAYLFSESGSYLGLWDLTDDQGTASLEVSSGQYKIRVDYLGYQFWSEVIDTDFLLAAVLSLPHHYVTITVAGDHNLDIQPRINLKTYLFTPTGSYLGRYEVTDNQGLAIFNLPEKEYKVRVDYLSQQFWSEGFNSVDKTVTIDEGIAEVTVTSSGFPIEGVKTYVFNGTGSYLGLYDTSDSDGKTLFRLPEGDYNFRADYMGNQYWSNVTTIIPDIDNPISISTGGGAFKATILKGPEEPLVGVKCYLFNESGSYLGKYGTTNGSGEVSYDISDGSYKIRIDCLGYQFWTDVFNIPGPLSITHTVLHHDVTITVACNYNGDILSGDNLKAYLFTPSGSYLGQYQVTNNLGEAVFNLPEKEYKIRVDYLSQQFWSTVFNSTDKTINIEEGIAEIEVLQGASPLSNVKVYAFNGSGSYLGLYKVTDAEGKASFRLPAAAYKFRGDHQGSQYWATETILAHQVNAITLSTGGGSFELAVEKEAGVPMAGIKVYVFSTAGSYLGMYDQTDDQGKATFDLSDGSYMFRADYLGYKFWTDVYAVPETLSETLSIPHQDVKVAVNKIYGDDIEPMENIKAYLFTASGSYMGTYANTDTRGQVTFSLPEEDYKVRADYLGSQYWTEVITWQDEDIDIDHGKVNIHVTDLGVDVANARVYLFTETGSYLGKYENTNEAGMASFTLPIKAYKFRVDYGGSQSWSGEVTPLPQEETDVDLALNILTLQLTNNPKPVRFDGVPMEHQPDGIMLASIGSLTGILTHSIVAQIPETKIYYYINDHLGTPMKVIDENNTVVWSADYNPFGDADITVNTFENNLRFPGQFYDQESQLHYNYHRYYQSDIGRYLSADPIGLDGGINIYAYVLNNPVRLSDPLGLGSIETAINIAVAIAITKLPPIAAIPIAILPFGNFIDPDTTSSYGDIVIEDLNDLSKELTKMDKDFEELFKDLEELKERYERSISCN